MKIIKQKGGSLQATSWLTLFLLSCGRKIGKISQLACKYSPFFLVSQLLQGRCKIKLLKFFPFSRHPWDHPLFSLFRTCVCKFCKKFLSKLQSPPKITKKQSIEPVYKWSGLNFYGHPVVRDDLNVSWLDFINLICNKIKIAWFILLFFMFKVRPT